MEEAEELVGLSDERAKELWEEATAVLGEATSLNIEDERVATLRGQAETLFNLIERISPVSEDNLFYDLALHPFGEGEAVRAFSLAGDGGRVFVGDATAGVILSIPQSTPRRLKSFPMEGLDEFRDLLAGSGNLYLLGKKTLYRYNISTGERDQPLSFDSFGKSTALDLYLEGNLYLLSPPKDQIYKFLNLGFAYSGAIAWIKAPLNLEKAVDLAVDGSIWILTSEGELIHLFGGEREPFIIKNLSTSLSRPKAVYTRPNFKNLYIAEQFDGGGRVMMVDKKGYFLRQFKGAVFSELIDIWVSDDERTLFALTPGKLYKIKL
jgi:hypothetical protein